MRKQYIWEQSLIDLMNDYLVYELTCKPLIKAFEEEDRVYLKNRTAIYVEDEFEIDFN
ncbi:hypothetical protein QOZ83_00055 [Romboutsia sedimentorum]|uniref:hypothetical protein n=1 Tax=Romboutsia sedimentorum TaxID=1368474 RepID=UPI0024DEBC6B|nr:hypothetical protein [Romboutsia sedimentorum]MDK2584236.1 hypothetical protein [Romboutsia sedimentorum]